ncbi:MAG: glycosyltransferase family 1 protein [Candidatus Zixiibacteriota bacterium]|nr:MAG: glycosyltransferase family 1 protein [candidate division Zixibacteria bacterium]
MRVAYFTESLPPLTDGVSRTLYYLKKTLESQNIEYKFYSPFCPADKEWKDKVYKIISVPFPLYTSYRISLPSFHDLEHALARFQPDLIHICSPFLSGLAAYDFGEKHDIPVVNSFHTRFISYLKYYGHGWLEPLGWNYLRWFYNRGHKIYVPSTATIRELSDMGFKNLALWARGIDTDRFSPKFKDNRLREKWSSDGKPVALFVGRLVAEKDIDILLEAHKILKRRMVEYRLVLVGEGPMRTKIEQTAPEIILTGHLDGEALSRAYASADFFAFPSTTETFGNVIQEAGASGLPAIGAAEGGVKDLILDGKTGFLARPKDASDFADKMELLITNNSLRNSLTDGAFEWASKNSWNIVNRTLIDDYKKIIDIFKKRLNLQVN